MNNSLFLRYYNTWREDPASIVFAPVADYFLMYGRIDDALKVCAEGLKYNQNSVSGRMVLVKAHLAKGKLKQADEELSRVLDLVPTHTRAQELRTEIDLAVRGDIRPAVVGEEPQPKADPPLAEAFEARQPASVIEVPDEVDEVTVQNEEVSVAKPAAWQTVTMAKIYAAQGHDDEARSIFSAILAHDPANEAARNGLQDLGGGS